MWRRISATHLILPIDKKRAKLTEYSSLRVKLKLQVTLFPLSLHGQKLSTISAISKTDVEKSSKQLEDWD